MSVLGEKLWGNGEVVWIGPGRLDDVLYRREEAAPEILHRLRPGRRIALVRERLDTRAVVLMVLLTAIWGGSFTFVKLGLRDLPVFGSICLRFVLATAILTVYCRCDRDSALVHGPERAVSIGGRGGLRLGPGAPLPRA